MRIIAALSLLAMLSSCALSVNEETVSSVIAPPPVQVRLVSANSYVHSKYGLYSYQRGFKIRVQNLAYTKSVIVYHKMANGTWTNVPATYSGPADNGFEYWTASTSHNGQNMGDRFAVKYTVNGATYWDNNNGADYKLSYNDGYILGAGLNVVCSAAWLYASAGQFSGSIDLKNIAYTKDVKVWYTDNNWATKKSVSASYQNGYSYGYAYVQSPNQWGFERWSFSVNNITASSLKYYVEYKVNGVTYYDNNFGMNYTVNRQ